MKSRIWVILFLFLIWCGFSNNFHIANLLLGLVVSAGIHFWVRSKPIDFKVDVLQFLALSAYMIYELVISSFQVAWDIITPTSKSQSTMIKLPLTCQHPVQVSLLMNLISLTPGTIPVDTEQDDTVLIVHLMFGQQQQQIIDIIKQRLEPKIMKAILHG